MPSLTLEQILATPVGKTPVIEELQSLIEYVILNRDDIGALTGGGDPGYNSSIDTRWLLTETGGVADTYLASLPNASGNVLIEGFPYWLTGQVATNTGATTLNVGTVEGAATVKKNTPAGLVELAAGDFPLFAARLYYSVTYTSWVLVNPAGGGITHTTSATIPTTEGNDGDVWYIPE